ncbi:ParB/RepB/Spo0J family partition protein [candidate division KSB1 bacterium]|nr:ParB/RepB/Spo0J family partition protein [candidate division KSB1 bacterium]
MVNKPRLGRGLGALIPNLEPIDSQPKRESSSIEQVAVANVKPNPFQPRHHFDPEALNELKNSIDEKGLIQPITVRRMEDKTFQLIAGERRLRAVQELGFEFIPAYILDIKSDEDMLELSLIENIQREDLNPIEVALGFQRLLTECNLTQEEVAQKVGKERSTVTNFLRLLKLPTPIQDSLVSKELTMGHARALITIEDPDLQLNLWQKIVKNRLSVRQAESLVKNATQPKKPVTPPEPEDIPVYIQDAENRLRTKFATQVRIVTKGDTGKIEIEFYSRDELEGILNHLDVY